jgi:alpha-beta hydrolase superfamily lysophospholipase
MNSDPAEVNVIHQQIARFGSKCRVYAPMYRQITLAGLGRLLTGTLGSGVTIDHGPHYDDVRDAWNYYLEHDNKGRGYVLVGHSQGSYILAELISQEIDGKPIEARMISAILPVPQFRLLGGKTSEANSSTSRCAARNRKPDA